MNTGQRSENKSEVRDQMTEEKRRRTDVGETSMETDAFFLEYTSQDAILKYTKATAGFGISYLLDHDYKAVYLDALRHLAGGHRSPWDSHVGIWVWRRDEPCCIWCRF